MMTKRLLWAKLSEATRSENIDLYLTNNNMLPFVSVIVPVYNDKKRISICIEKLLNQTYPKDKYEIIIIDNNSTDTTPDIVESYPVKLLFEKNIQSSYAARNKGIKKAKGEIIAFTDSDCQPTKEWIENGIMSLLNNKVDLVAGHVEFIFKNKKDPYEIYDSIEHMQQQKSVKKGMAATANLFTNKCVFEKIWLFQNVESGGDRSWTCLATQNNFRLLYDSTSIVYHPTRNKKEVLRKKFRVGTGRMNIWESRKKPVFLRIISMLKLILPPFFLVKNKEINTIMKIKIYLASWKGNIYVFKWVIKSIRDELV
jgi:glycosyltransferase involved in cell wall biosynthesis